MAAPRSVAATVRRHRHINSNYYSFIFGPFPEAPRCKPGQFLHLQLPHSDLYFRRAMSVASVNDKTKEVEIIFKVFGRGTKLLSQFDTQDPIGILGPLGRPFSTPKNNQNLIMVAGGVGFPPLLYLATELIGNGFPAKQIHFYYGGKGSEDIIERARIKKLGMHFHPVTQDGTFGEKGLVTQIIERDLKRNKLANPFIYGCGPDGMLKATNELGLKHNIPGELSLEAPMPCGIGVCLGCIVPLTRGGNARVCVDGPVFNIGEVKL